MDSATRRVYSENFKELKAALSPEDAAVEANRCLWCYDAPCAKACPTHIDVPRFIKQIASGNLIGSAKTILEANALGHSCARACPVEVLCEGACVYHAWQERPIEIARLQRRATDHLHLNGADAVFKPAPANGRKAAVIGAGPAGLSCAAYLRRLGFAVTLYDREKTPGGLNTRGIAEYKMTQRVSLDEVKRLLGLGIEIKLGQEIGGDIPAGKLLSDFDAVFLGCGLGATRKLGIPGEGLRGVWDALSFIRFVKERNLKPLGKSRVTVVLGGGNTAIDAVTQSKRIGAERVMLAYRRGREEMGAYDFEVELAKSDGAEFLWNAAPTRILGKTKVEGIEFCRTQVRQGRVVSVPGSKCKLACDRVIKAVGQEKDRSLAEALGLQTESDGRIKADPETLATSNPRVFAGGDAVNGGAEVVNAAADGKRAAWAIWRRLNPGLPPPPGNDYWVSTIEGRLVAPIPERETGNGERQKGNGDDG